MNSTYLLLGSNIGDSLQQLQTARKLVKKNIGELTAASSLYATKAWGYTDQPDFLNQVIIVKTPFDARETLQHILAIEKKMGRIRTTRNAPRLIDIDILFFNHDIISENNLTIPHPEIQNRRFVLTPLNELSPQFIHPVLHKPILELLTICPDQLDVKKF